MRTAVCFLEARAECNSDTRSICVSARHWYPTELSSPVAVARCWPLSSSTTTVLDKRPVMAHNIQQNSLRSATLIKHTSSNVQACDMSVSCVLRLTWERKRFEDPAGQCSSDTFYIN
jgi:hypothetical protein